MRYFPRACQSSTRTLWRTVTFGCASHDSGYAEVRGHIHHTECERKVSARSAQEPLVVGQKSTVCTMHYMKFLYVLNYLTCDLSRHLACKALVNRNLASVSDDLRCMVLDVMLRLCALKFFHVLQIAHKLISELLHLVHLHVILRS